MFGNDQALVEQVAAAADGDRRAGVAAAAGRTSYRKLLDSDVADLKNVGGPYGGAITAAVFLSEFVGDVPWAHLDIAGPMKVDADESWRSKGATGFGTRLLIDLATSNFTPARLSVRPAQDELAVPRRRAGARHADGDSWGSTAPVVAGGEHRGGQGVAPRERARRGRTGRASTSTWAGLSVVGQPAEVALRDQRHPAAHEPGRRSCAGRGRTSRSA